MRSILRPARPAPAEHLAPTRDWHREIAAATRPPPGLALPAAAGAGGRQLPPEPAGSGTALARRDSPPHPTLDVSGHAYADAEFAALLAGLSDRVRSLQLGGNDLSAASLAALVAMPMPRLKTLAWRDNPLGGGALHALGHAPWPALQRLDLRGCALNDADVAALARARLRLLRELRLANNDLGPRSGSLLAGPAFAELELLDVAGNALGEAGLAALLSGSFHRLCSLDLAHTGGGATTVRRLVFAALPELRRLDVSGLTLRPAQATLLGQRFAPRLLALSARASGLSAAGVSALVAPDWPALRSFDLDDNRIGQRGLSALVEARADGRLPRLVRLLVPEHNGAPPFCFELLDAAWDALDFGYRRRRRTLVAALMPAVVDEPAPVPRPRRVRLVD